MTRDDPEKEFLDRLRESKNVHVAELKCYRGLLESIDSEGADGTGETTDSYGRDLILLGREAVRLQKDIVDLIDESIRHLEKHRTDEAFKSLEKYFERRDYQHNAVLPHFFKIFSYADSQHNMEGGG